MLSQYSVQVQKTAPKRGSSPDEDERRLLGLQSKQSNEAVPIGKPGITRGSHTFKPRGGMGPRPTNTLSTSRNLPNQTYSANSSRPTARDGKQQALAVEVSRGGNVDRMGHERSSEAGFPTPPSAKRQKIRHSNSAETISDESIDNVSPGAVSFVKGQFPVKAISSHSQGSETRRNGMSRVGDNHEFYSVEAMMDSNPRNAKRRDGVDPQKSSSPLMDDLSRSNSSRIVVEAEKKPMPSTVLPKPAYQGTLRRQPDVIRRNGVMKGTSNNITGSKSPHFTSSPELPPRPGAPTAYRPATRQGDDLRTKFVSTDGKTRGTDNLSSDELEGPVTIGAHADVLSLSPNKRHQPVSSKSSTVQIAISPEESFEADRSNIKPTKFQSKEVGDGKTKCRNNFDEDYLQDNSSWAVGLAAINIPGKKEMYQKSNMQLVHDEHAGCYYVKEGGKTLQSSSLNLQLRPQSLQRCFLDTAGRRVRFESSKRGVEDNVLDLQFSSEKALVTLIKKIQQDTTNLKVINVGSEKMQKMFQIKRDQGRTTPVAIERMKDFPEDVQMAAINRGRREARNEQTQDTSNIKRPRKSIVNGLTGVDSVDSTSFGLKEKYVLGFRPNGLPDPPRASSENQTTLKSEFSSKQAPSHNDQLRRSTRTSGVPFRFTDDSIDFPEEPRVEKYSKRFGLGQPWKKPLSYPKEGKKKATVDFEDLERLDEGEFLNDNLVSFYMRYLEEELRRKNPDLAKRIYFFNSFFFDRLNNSDSGPKSINYEGVQRWTKGVDLFGLDYVVVPVNELTHWYVAIICNLPALDRRVARSDDLISPHAASDQARATASAQLTTELNDAVDEQGMSEPEQKETRESFAEMSLDSKQNERQPSDDSLMGELRGKANAKAEDEEMLDVPDDAGTGERPSSAKEVKTSKQGEEDDDPLEQADEAPKAAAPSKKQKRKSIAPVTRTDPNKPVIMTFDSFGHPHPHTVRVLKIYLQEEGKAKRGGMDFDVASIKGITAKSIPQQSNFSDCGLFMLGYIEKFLQGDPQEFITKIIRREYDDRKDWPKMVPSTMRKNLREQLQGLHEEAQDERRLSAIKAGKHSPGSRVNKGVAPTSQEISKRKGEADSNKANQPNSVSSPKTRKAALAAIRSVDEPATPENGKYERPKLIEEDRPNFLPQEPEGPINAACTITDTSLDASLIMLNSTPTHRKSPSSESHTDIPSSQPPNPPTPKEHSMPGSFPSPGLPTEIEDSQPQPPVRVSPRAKLKEPVEVARSPEPSEWVNAAKTKEEQKRPDEVYSNWSPSKTGELHAEPPPPALSGRRSRRRKGAAQPVVGKKVASEVIAIDDD